MVMCPLRLNFIYLMAKEKNFIINFKIEMFENGNSTDCNICVLYTRTKSSLFKKKKIPHIVRKRIKILFIFYSAFVD